MFKKDEELNATQRHLDMSGVPMPNFMNVGSSLHRELNAEGYEDMKMFNFQDYLGFEGDMDQKLGLPATPRLLTTPDLIIEEEEFDSDESDSSIGKYSYY
jgi:hypothetical protein